MHWKCITGNVNPHFLKPGGKSVSMHLIQVGLDQLADTAL